jgi:hypothetical protein
LGQLVVVELAQNNLVLVRHGPHLAKKKDAAETAYLIPLVRPAEKPCFFFRDGTYLKCDKPL